MYVRTLHEPIGLLLDTDEPRVFVLPGRRGTAIEVTLRRAVAERELAGWQAHLACIAQTEYLPGRKLIRDFEDLAAGRLPDGSDPDANPPNTTPRLNEGGQLESPSDAPFFVMPKRLQDEVVALRGVLGQAALRTVGLLRWRTAQEEGPFDAIRTRGALWSLYGETWHHLPTAMGITSTISRHRGISGAIQEDVQQALDDEREEPLAHRLWLEAWQLRSASPRSALLIGMSALEVGVKSHVVHAVPDSAWLMTELQSPPTLKMLVEYLPSLSTSGGPSLRAPSSEVVQRLRTAQTVRNTLTHTGRGDIEASWLHDVLRTIRQVLWSTDVASGASWAAAADDERQELEAIARAAMAAGEREMLDEGPGARG